MFFQISPVRKSPKKGPKPKFIDPAEEITELSLAPFTGNPKLSFEDVTVKSISRRKLLVKNPHNYDVELNIYHNIPDDMNVTLNWSHHGLKANTETILEIVWCPQSEGSWRFSLNIEGSRRINRVVPVSFKSVSPKKKKSHNKQPKISYVSRKVSPVKKSSIQKKKSTTTTFVAPPCLTNSMPNITITTPKNLKFRKANKENMSSNTQDSPVFVSPSKASFQFEMTGTLKRRETYTLRTGYVQSNILASSTLYNVDSNVKRTEQNSYVDHRGRAYTSDCSFNDSLEIPPAQNFNEKILHDDTDCVNTPLLSHNFSHRLQSESFTISPVSVPKPHLHHNNSNLINYNTVHKPPNNIADSIFPHLDIPSSNITFDMERCSSPKLCNLSTETYVKGNLSSETYTKADTSAGTYVKDNSLSDFAALPLSPLPFQHLSANTRNNQDNDYHYFLHNKTSPVAERHKWISPTCKDSYLDKPFTCAIEHDFGNFQSTKLGSIVEESFSRSDTSYENSSKRTFKRPSPNSFCTICPKRPNVQVPQTLDRSKKVTWSKKPVSIKTSKKTSGLNLQHVQNVKDDTEKQTVITVTDTHHVAITNPFILAATTMIDPFMTLDIYFDHAWIEEQERNFKKWLNALLTPPDELDSNIEGPTVNIAKLWQQCKNKEVAEAPTKEAISQKYHTSARLNSLRKTARSFYMSGDIPNVLSKVVLTVETDKLMIRKDRSVHLDLGLQAETMSLLLSYNPLWLRIGLETIYNQQIPLISNSDVMGLSTFLMNRLFRDPILLKKYKSIHAPKYVQEVKKHILKKFLILVYFLDQAKTKKLIAHDPCLFCKNAPVKESRELLIRFARDTVSSIGDITKYLKLLGYVVVHKQTYINEFDYAVKNLGADLRDGVRLTKVMEIILLEEDLTSKLRVPAISILQKIYNTKLAFDALERAGYTILQDITPKDLVEGHREKTLSFLWQIIYKLEAPLMVKSATTIQTWWRSLGVSLKRIKLRRSRQHRENAAQRIQCWYRNQKMSQRFVQLHNLVVSYIYNRRREVAVIKIQSYFRMYIHRKKYNSLKSTIIKCQALARRWLFNNHYKQRICAAIKIQSFLRMCLARTNFLRHKSAVLTIQRHYLAYRLMKMEQDRYIKLKYTVLFIQNLYRANQLMKLERSKYLRLQEATIIIQRKCRAKKLMQLQLNSYTTIKCAVITIQKWYRSVKLMQECKTYYTTLKISVRTIEERYLAKKLMQQQTQEFKIIRESTIIIQQKYRAHKEMILHRDYFRKLRKATVTCQSRYRAKKACEVQRRAYLLLKKHVIICQNRFRANCEMRAVLRSYQNLKRSVIVVQTRYRAQQKMKEDFRQFQLLKLSTIRIQRRYRAWIAMKIQRREYFQLKRTTIRIQQLYRAKLSMRTARCTYIKIKSATIVIQSHFRAQQQRLQFTKFRKAAICIQQRYRARLQMKSHVLLFVQLKTATIILQQHFRARILMEKHREEYNTFRSATITLQRRFRATCLMRKELTTYTQLKHATIMIQRKYRAKRAMRSVLLDYQKLKLTVRKVQILYRAKIQMKSEKAAYAKLKQTVIFIQQTFRACHLMKLHRSHYTALRSATIVIQRRFRAQKSMQVCMHEYNSLKRVTVMVQRHYRSILQMRSDKTAYDKLKTATLIIQSRYRARCKMKVEMHHYNNLKNAAIVIQRRYRAQKLKRLSYCEYQTLRNEVVKIQRLYRAKVEMRQAKETYNKLKRVTVVIQNRFRATRLMRTELCNYIKLRKATILIQRKFRANKLMRSNLQEYQKLKVMVLLVQKRYRSKLLMRAEINHYNRLKYYTIAIQRGFRANKLMKRERKHYIQLKKSTITIQRRWRETLLAKQQKSKYEQLKKTTILVQSKYRAKLAMRIEAQRYLSIKRSVHILQQHFRAFILKKCMISDYKRLRAATVLIQRHYRATLLMRIVRKDYILLKQVTLKIQQRFRARKEMQHHLGAYQRLRFYTIFVQRKFRNKQLMIKVREIFMRYKHSVSIIEQRFIAYKLSLTIRREFVQMKQAAILIQTYYRSYVIMKKQRYQFLLLTKSAAVIQQHYRANRVMQICRQEYLEKRKNAISIQRWWRTLTYTRNVHKSFEQVKRSTIIIQRFYRQYRLYKNESSYYTKLKYAVVIIQRRYRALYLMRQQLKSYLLMKSSAIFIQRYFRNYLLMKQERATFVRTKTVVLNIQPQLKGYLVRKKYSHFLSAEGKQERKEQRLKKTAATKIQALWRGHKSRSLEDPKLVKIRQRTKVARAKAVPENTLGHRCKQAVQLLNTENITILQILKVLQDLEYITRRCGDSCRKLSKTSPEYLYLIVSSATRSLPEMNACNLATHILINFCKYHETSANSWIPEYLDNMFTVMLHWCDKESPVFSSLCTLLWLFAHNSEYKTVIKNIPNYHQRMSKIETLCLRKSKMVNRSSYKGSSMFLPYSNLPLPSLKPDWGLDLKNKPKTFTNSVHALNNLLLLLR